VRANKSANARANEIANARANEIADKADKNTGLPPSPFLSSIRTTPRHHDLIATNQCTKQSTDLAAN
jgi:hypothetical protein